MSIGDDKTRIAVTMEKQLKEALDKQAKAENRTTANLINTIIIKYLKEIAEDAK